MPATREDLVKIAREAVGGLNRPSRCMNPASYDPPEWVLEAMQRAYERGSREGSAETFRAALDASLRAPGAQ